MPTSRPALSALTRSCAGLHKDVLKCAPYRIGLSCRIACMHSTDGDAMHEIVSASPRQASVRCCVHNGRSISKALRRLGPTYGLSASTSDDGSTRIPAVKPSRLRMTATGRLPSFAPDESGHSAAYSLNVGNLRDTGHSVGATPPAAMADQLPHN